MDTGTYMLHAGSATYLGRINHRRAVSAALLHAERLGGRVDLVSVTDALGSPRAYAAGYAATNPGQSRPRFFGNVGSWHADTLRDVRERFDAAMRATR